MNSSRQVIKTPTTSATVIGLVPECMLHPLLSSSVASGRLEPVAAVAVGGVVHVWRQDTCTLTEDLAPASSRSVRHLNHPRENGSVAGMAFEASDWVYLVDSAGTLAAYRGPLSKAAAAAVECDAAVTLNLDSADERVTVLTATTLRTGETILLLASSQGRLWMGIRMSHPLMLRVKPLLANQQDEQKSALRGIYDRLMGGTPHRPPDSGPEDDSKNSIVGIFPLDHKNHWYSVTDTGCLSFWSLTKNRDEDYQEQLLHSLSLLSLFERNVHSLQVLRGQIMSPHSLVLALQICHRKDEARLYLLHLPLHPLTFWIQPSLAKFAWLSRYATSLILQKGGLVCHDLVIVNVDNSIVAYSVWQDTPLVTVSAVRFSNDSNNNSSPQVVDVDLPTTIVPRVLSVGYDTTTDGVLLMSQTGCILNTHVTFPGVANSITSETTTAAMVEVLTTHLLSAFAVHQRGTNEYALPPSITSAANNATLSQAVVSATLRLLPTPSQQYGNNTLDTIAKHLQIHTDFVNFLLHAGIYKRVLPSFRIQLRNVGECIIATGHLVSVWQEVLLNTQDDNHDEAKKKISKSLIGIELDMAEFGIKRLDLLQQCTQEEWEVNQVSILIGTGLSHALQYRAEKSDMLYNVPVTTQYDDDTNECIPWTSQVTFLQVLERQLRLLKQIAKENQHVVELMARVLLDGYYDMTFKKRDEASYDEAKKLAISSVQQMSDNDDLALELSIRHGYFEGVVQVCHEHSTKQGVSVGAEKYDLGAMLQSSSSNNEDFNHPYARLYVRRDNRTGLSFPKFVLRWYTDRALFGTVLDLGKNCPEILTQYMEEDSRLADLRWMQYVRTGHYSAATSSLVKLGASSTAVFLGKRNSRTEARSRGSPFSLKDRKLVLSLAKISSIIVDKEHNWRRNEEERKIIDDNLELCYAQQILLDYMNPRQAALWGEDALPANDLLLLALDQIVALKDAEDKARVCLVGLSIAGTLTDDDDGGGYRASQAARFWSLALNADMELWAELARRDEIIMSEKERLDKLSNTVFYILSKLYYESKNVGKRNDDIGFLGNESIEKLLLTEAQKKDHPGIEELVRSVVVPMVRGED